jgi:AcrR family transcriptional regulator
MARRSAHTPEELRQRILDAAQSIIERDGLVGLSAREIARLIGYSPGTLYNIFENLDDVLLTLQTQLVGSLVDVMKSVPVGSTPAAHIDALARAYLDFALDNKRMWNLLFTHYLPQGIAAPQALHDNVNGVSSLIAEVISPLMPGASKIEIEIAAKTFWASVHGITAIAVTDKGPTLTSATAHVFLKQLITTYTRGLTAR